MVWLDTNKTIVLQNNSLVCIKPMGLQKLKKWLAFCVNSGTNTFCFFSFSQQFSWQWLWTNMAGHWSKATAAISHWQFFPAPHPEFLYIESWLKAWDSGYTHQWYYLFTLGQSVLGRSLIEPAVFWRVTLCCICEHLIITNSYPNHHKPDPCNQLSS